MYNKNHKEELHILVDSKSPLIFIRHFDFKMIDSMIDAIASENRANVYEYHQALGSIDFKTKKPHEYQDISEDSINISSSLESFLKHYREEGYNGEIYFVLKDIYKELENPNTLSLFRRIAEDTQNRIGYHVCIFVISTRLKVPLEIEHYINLFEIEPPGRGDIIEIIDDFAKTHGISIDSRVKSELAISLKGVSSFQINRVLTLAYQNNGDISISDKKLILDEKEQFIKILRSSIIDKTVLPVYNDIFDQLQYIVQTVENCREFTSSLVDMYCFNNDYRMNVIMKRLTIVSTVFIPLTFLAGIWGMNFMNMPELNWKYGYAFAWGTMLLVGLFTIIYMKKKKWF